MYSTRDATVVTCDFIGEERKKSRNIFRKKSKMKQECAQESEISNMVLEKSRIFSTRNATVVSFERNKEPFQNIICLINFKFDKKL